MTKNILIVIAILSLSGLVNAADSATDTSTVDENASLNDNKGMYTDVANAIDVYIANIQLLRTHLDNSRFNLDELLLTLEMDDSEIKAFVSDAIQFQQYLGLLRGATGTLKSRAGNSLDQSLLLASLLNAGGWESRIVAGHLNDADALRLISGIMPSEVEKEFGENNTLQPVLDNFGVTADKATDSSAENLTTLNEEVKHTHTLLNTMLTKQGIIFEPHAVDELLVKEAKQYFWVEYRLGGGDEWEAVHPAFGQSQFTPDVTAVSYFKDSVPESYFHTLRVEAFIESRLGNKTEIASLMEPWQRPVANLDGVALTYVNMPNGLSLTNLDDFESGVKNTQFFTPMFNNVRVGGNVFDLKGRLLDGMALEGSMAGVFKTLSDNSDKAIGGLGGLGNSPDDKPEPSSFGLISQWLEFTLISPDGQEQKYRRYIYGPFTDGQDENKQKLALMTEHVFMLNTGQQSLDFLADRFLQNKAEHNTQLKTLLHYSLLKDEGTVLPKKSPEEDFKLLAQYQLFENVPSGKGLINYRAEPGIIGFRKGYSDFDQPFFSVDIIHNKRRILQKRTDGYFTQPSYDMEIGIWETITEKLPAKEQGQRQQTDTFKIFQAANEQAIALEIISNEQQLNSQKDRLGEQTAFFIQRDLADGYTVIVPSKQPAETALNGWWRINTSSGETLGMTGDGRGGEFVEYMTKVTNELLGLANGINALKDCQKIPNMEKQLCCLMEAHANNVFGGAYAGALTHGMAEAGVALFNIVDFGLQEATGGQGIAPKIKYSICH